MLLVATARAKGEYEMLNRKAEGLGDIVKAVGGGQVAFQLLMLEHMDKLAETSAKAISNIKFDKVVVWDGGGDGKNGSSPSATAGFIRSLASSLPPATDMLKEVAGVRVDVICNDEATEADWFFTFLEGMDAPASARAAPADVS